MRIPEVSGEELTLRVTPGRPGHTPGSKAPLRWLQGLQQGLAGVDSGLLTWDRGHAHPL